MINLEKRIAALELAKTARKHVVWLNEGETESDALARFGFDENDNVMFIQWVFVDPEGDAQSQC